MSADRTPPFSPLVDRIAGEGARAWDIHVRAQARKRAGEDVIVLSVGDPDFATPQAVVERAKQSLDAGRTHYTPTGGEFHLRRAIAGHHARLTGQAAAPEQVVVTAGAQNALFAVAQCLLPPGSEAIVPEPSYVTYEALLRAPGATPVTVPLTPEAGFQPRPADIAAAVTARSRAVVLNTPHNPTGAVIPRGVLEEIGAICRRHDLWLISDEVYADLTYDAPHVSPAVLPGLEDRTVVISSLSKSHAMTGWRLGWAVGPRGLAEHLENLLLCMLYGSPGFVQDAAETALSGELAEPAEMRDAYRRRRDLVCARLEAVQGLACHRPAAGMFVMVDVRGSGMEAQDFAWDLLAREGVSLLPAEAFGRSAAGHLRLSLAAPEAVLEDACGRIARFLGR